MMAGGSSASAVFEFKYTVTTNASGSSDKKSALPINLYGQTGVEISVDWGDGSTSVLKPSDYTASSSLASVHEYASVGTYQITASSSSWSNAYLLSCYADATISSANNANQPVYWWRRTLKSVDSPLPPVKGVMRLASASATSMTASDNDLGFLFHRCEKMTSIPANLFENAGHIEEFNSTFYNCIVLPSLPAGLFDPCVSALNFSDCFRYCLALTSIPVSFFKYCTAATNMYNVFRFCNKIPSVPADLFKYNTHVTNLGGAFSKCDALKNFTLCIGSPNVATVTDFILNASGVTRIVCVPANSTTYNSFNSYKNTSNNVTVSTSNADCGIEEEEIDDGAWQFTVNTQATASGEKKSAIPINLYGQTEVELTVDWGDNTTSTLTPSDYTANDSTASVHEYASAGEYTVTVASNDWKNTYLLSYKGTISSDSNTKTSSLYWFRRTATSIDTKLPQIKGIADIYTTPTTSNNSLQGLFYKLEKITSIPSGLFDKNTAVTDFQYCFSDCISLQSIPSGLFDKNTVVTDFQYCFRYCTSLQSIPSGLFDSNTAVTSFEGCFYGCRSLQSIPSGLFDKNTAVTSFYTCFNGCSSLQSIPSGLFDKNTEATSFNNCFWGCSSLQSIPSGLFDKNTAVTSFHRCFGSCSSLQSIPSGLFDKNMAVTNFYDCFVNCTNLLNFHLKIGSSSVTTFTGFIPNASNVDRILCVPANSTTYTNASSFANASNGVIVSTDYIDCAEVWEFTIDTEATASGEKKTGIPFNLYGQTGIKLLVDWGDNTTSTLTPSNYTASNSTASVHEYAAAGEYTVTVASNDWDNTYLLALGFKVSSIANSNAAVYYWRRTLTNVQKIPQIKGTKYLSSQNNTTYYTSNNAFTYFFNDCSNIESIPSNLFDYNTNATNFSSCFAYCSSLQSIPSGLFDKNTAVTYFSSCFSGCSSITSIPSGLFDKNTAVTDFRSTFRGCSSLVSIQSGLFDKNTAATDFQYCFSDCSSITSIPSGIFDKNTNATTFNACFSGCSSLASIPSGLFDKNTAVTYFSSCFSDCSSITSIPSGLFDKNTAATSFWGCFSGCSSLASIPSGLFDKNTAVTDFSACFSGCSSITSIPSGLFDKNTRAESFYVCFNGCSALASIPSGLFDKNTAVTYFSSCFSDCSSITSIPSGLFDKNTRVESFYYCFNGCSALASIPSGLLAKNTAVTDLRGFFNACIQLLDFRLKIGSSSIDDFTDFIPNASNVTCILCVPANSTTYTTASSYANSSNNIIVSTDYIDCAETWEFTIDTEAVVSGNKKSGIPFVLLHENADIVLLVDWGDGTSQRLTSANYTAGTVTPTHVYPDYRASVHTYAAAGRYTITVASSNWENTYLYVVSFADLLYEGNANSAMWWYRRTLVSVDTPFPKIKGAMCSNSTGGDVDYNATITANSFNYAFMGCQALTTIPSNLFDNNTSATNFTHCFDSCTAITSIPPEIFSKHVNATGFTYCFSNCSSLVSIPSNLFVNNTKATDLYYTFYRCTSITSIPAGLFDSQINATRFDNCFYYCTSLTSIPYNLFHKNTKVTGFSWCFSTCTSLTSIPAGLFDKNTSAASFSYCFQNCTALTHIPAGLFDNNTNATGFYDTFTGCTSLASVPNGLFAKNTKVTNFSECFAGCTSLLNFHLKIGSSSVAYFNSFIPDASNVDRILCVPASSTTYTKATAFATANNGVIVSTDIMDCAESWEFTIDTEATTAGDVITGIPIIMYKQTGSIIVDWGDNTTSVLSNDATSWDNGSRSPNEYGSVHEYASPGQYTVTITSTNWSDLYLMYVAQYNPIDSMGNRAHCIAYFRKTLVSVDTILPKVKGIRFGNDDSGTDNSLRELFYDCSHLASIPADLFYNNTSVTSFFGCFYKCTSLASIPIGLFNYNSEATNFECCFSVCSTITSIPSRLFEYNTKATNFTTCFSGTSIISIPSGLFDYAPFATTFEATFANCRAITSIPTGLFDNNPEAVSFARTFQYCAALASIPTDLFKYNVKAKNFTGTFRNTSITSIPADLFKYNVDARFFDVCFYSTKITSIPADLFKYNVNATRFGSQAFGGCFELCYSLSSFTLNINSSVVTEVYDFVTLKSTVTRTINVPANSATYTAFSNVASNLGLTIVGV